jgi:hypothetical protein
MPPFLVTALSVGDATPAGGEEEGSQFRVEVLGSILSLQELFM